MWGGDGTGAQDDLIRFHGEDLTPALDDDAICATSTELDAVDCAVGLIVKFRR